MLHEQLSRKVIGAFLRVYHLVGYGQLEATYQRSLAIELRRDGMVVACEVALRVFYRGEPVGDYRIDMIVEDVLLVECKACDKLVRPHELQILNYLNASRIDVGLLFNFGPSPTIKRFVRSNNRVDPGILTSIRVSPVPPR
jgi:GxxExxY protein